MTHKNKSFDCNMCSRSFKFRYRLNHHIKISHLANVEDLFCRLCNKIFKDSDTKKFHEKRCQLLIIHSNEFNSNIVIKDFFSKTRASLGAPKTIKLYQTMRIGLDEFKETFNIHNSDHPKNLWSRGNKSRLSEGTIMMRVDLLSTWFKLIVWKFNSEVKEHFPINKMLLSCFTPRMIHNILLFLDLRKYKAQTKRNMLEAINNFLWMIASEKWQRKYPLIGVSM